MAADPRTYEEPRLALIASVALETEPVLRRMDDMRETRVGRKAAFCGVLAGEPVLLLPGGIGKSNAAQALTAALECHPLRGVIGFGVAGAYSGSGLAVGQLALASAEVYGDEGIEAPGGWLSTETIGIPLLQTGGRASFNTMPLLAERVSAASTALLEAGLEHLTGPFVTVSACSGTAARGDRLRARFNAIAESMEGAAWAHVAALYEIPFIEVRGISNLVEDRDLTRWRLNAAAEAAGRAVEQLVAGW